MAMFQKRSPDNPLAAREPPAPERMPQPLTPPPAPPQFLRESEARTQIGADAVINGKLAFTTPTRVEGKLKGELRCSQLLIIGPHALVEGLVKADEVRIEGTVSGEIVETRKVEVAARGRLTAKVSAQLLVIRDGAFFEGECTVGPETRLSSEET